jgi:predicted RNase H-like HicB family nuclease
MSESLRFTVRYEDAGEGWVTAQVVEVPGAISQGRGREEARENVVDALRLILSPEPGSSPTGERHDSLEVALHA